MNVRAILPRLLLALALAGAVVWAYLNRSQLDPGSLQLQIQSLGGWAPLAFVAVFALATVLFLPGALFGLAGGALFGPVWGSVWNLIGATLGASLAFLTARYVASDWVARRSGGRLKGLIEGVEAEGWRFVAFVRLVPVFPFNLLNYALGLTRIRLSHYVLATCVAMIPGTVAYTWLGHAGREVAAGSETAVRNLLLALGLSAVVAFLPSLIKRLRGTPAAAGGKLCSADLKQRLERHDDIAVLDVRPNKDYTGPLGHIAGSLNIPIDELPKRLAELVSYRDRPLAVICRTNRMSGKAVGFLRAAGFKQALLVDDGMVGWQGQQGQALPAGQELACAAMPARGSVSAATGKAITIVIQNAPYKGDNKAWHALRLAGAALAEDMKVRVHMLDDGVQLARHSQQVPTGMVDLKQLLAELMECGLEVRACAMAMNECKLAEHDLISGIHCGSMTALAGWIKESDVVLTF